MSCPDGCSEGTRRRVWPMGNAKYRRPEMPVVDYSSKWQGRIL